MDTSLTWVWETAGLVGLGKEKAGEAKAAADQTVRSSLMTFSRPTSDASSMLFQQLPGKTNQTLGGLVDESRNLLGNAIHSAAGFIAVGEKKAEEAADVAKAEASKATDGSSAGVGAYVNQGQSFSRALDERDTNPLF